MTTTNLCGKPLYVVLDDDDEDQEYCILDEGHEGYHTDGCWEFTEDGHIVIPKCERGPLARTRGRMNLERRLTNHPRCWY